MSQGNLELPYNFGGQRVILMRYENDTTYIRNSPNSTDSDNKGGIGEWARWLATKHDNGFKFKNVKTGKYLRIVGNDVNVGGDGGPWTLFTAHGSGNERKLES